MKLLRRRMACLYAATASIILTFALAGFFMLRIEETRQAQADSFQSAWNAISYRLQSETMVTHSFLARAEAENHLIIHIEENGAPLLYPGSWTPPTSRQTLIGRAKKQAEGQGVSTCSAPVSSSFASTSRMSVRGDQGEQYYAMFQTIAKPKGMQSLCVIYYRTPVLKSLRKTILALCGLDLAGILCLSAISWHFVGWSLRPVEESRKRQAEFIAAASHELRSPLAVLRSGAAAALAAPQEAESLLQTMDSECSRMSRLIDDLLLLASADSGTWEIHREKTDMDTLLIETYESFLPLCQEKQVSLHLKLPQTPLPAILSDPQRIRQILSILLDNALAYSPAHGEIQICAKAPAFSPRRPGYLTLQVKDQGCGIPDPAKPRVFDRFYRADQARSKKAHFGLGLSIAKELACLHQGTISVTDNPGGGSCFTVTLPALAGSRQM